MTLAAPQHDGPSGRWSGCWRLHREEVALNEHALRGEDRVQRLRETTVDRGVGKGFDDLDRAEPDVESGVHVHFELRLATAEGGEHPEGDQLPLRRGQAGTVVDIAEAVGDYMVSKGGGDVGESRDDVLAARAVDRVEHGRAALISRSVDLGSEEVCCGLLVTGHRVSVPPCSSSRLS